MMHWYSNKHNKAFAVKANALLTADDVEFRMAEKYDTYDWLTEPSESWKLIIKERAEQLRDENKYLRLWYSGGEDSQTILNCFIENNIPIDEIALMRVSIENNFYCPGNDEINKISVPFLNENRDLLRGAKIKFFDIGSRQYEEYMKNFSLLTGNMVEFRISYQNSMHYVFPGINDVPGIMNIDGVDKPCINHDSVGFYWYYNDAALLSYVMEPEVKKFYQHFFIDSLKVHCKQVYTAVNDYLNGSYNVANLRDCDLECRDTLYKPISLIKATAQKISDKNRYAVRGCLINPETRHIYRSYLRAINGTGLDKKHFNNENPIFFYKGIETKKYRMI